MLCSPLFYGNVLKTTKETTFALPEKRRNIFNKIKADTLVWLGSKSWSRERSDEQEAEEQTWCGLGVIKLL